MKKWEPIWIHDLECAVRAAVDEMSQFISESLAREGLLSQCLVKRQIDIAVLYQLTNGADLGFWTFKLSDGHIFKGSVIHMLCLRDFFFFFLFVNLCYCNMFINHWTGMFIDASSNDFYFIPSLRFPIFAMLIVFLFIMQCLKILNIVYCLLSRAFLVSHFSSSCVMTKDLSHLYSVIGLGPSRTFWIMYWLLSP